MTLDPTILFPAVPERISGGDPSESVSYMKELIFTLQKMYEDLAEAINGNVKGSVFGQQTKWTPLLKDTGDTSTTFTYVNDGNVGWVFRQGLIVDVWFDIDWNGASAALSGNLYVDLPYIVGLTDGMPFTGVIQPSSVTFTAGTDLVINAIGNSYRGEIWTVGDGVPTANQLAVTSGRLIGHVRYLGKGNE